MDCVEIYLRKARDRLKQPYDWDKTGIGPGWCPIRAVEYSVRNANVLFPMIIKLKAVLRLRAAVPKAYRTISPECLVRYNADPQTTHEDILALFDRAIASSPENAVLTLTK